MFQENIRRNNHPMNRSPTGRYWRRNIYETEIAQRLAPLRHVAVPHNLF